MSSHLLNFRRERTELREITKRVPTNLPPCVKGGEVKEDIKIKSGRLSQQS